MPANEAPPGSSKLMLYTNGSTSLGNIRMIVNVVMSRLTRVPALSLSTGRVGRKDTTYRGPDEALTMTELRGGRLSDTEVANAMLGRTPFIVELLQHFSNNLPHRLDRLDVVFGLGVVLLEVFYREPHYKWCRRFVSKVKDRITPSLLHCFSWLLIRSCSAIFW